MIVCVALCDLRVGKVIRTLRRDVVDGSLYHLRSHVVWLEMAHPVGT